MVRAQKDAHALAQCRCLAAGRCSPRALQCEAQSQQGRGRVGASAARVLRDQLFITAASRGTKGGILGIPARRKLKCEVIVNLNVKSSYFVTPPHDEKTSCEPEQEDSNRKGEKDDEDSSRLMLSSTKSHRKEIQKTVPGRKN